MFTIASVMDSFGLPRPLDPPLPVVLRAILYPYGPCTSPRTRTCETHLAGRVQGSKACPHPTVMPSERGSWACRVCRAASLARGGGMGLPSSTGRVCVNCCVAQNSRPLFISAVEDCEYTFSWPTAAACPVQKSVHDDCQVTNPSTGKGWHCQ